MFQHIRTRPANLDQLVAEYLANGGKITYCAKGARTNDGLFDTAAFPTKEQKVKNKSMFGRKPKS